MMHLPPSQQPERGSAMLTVIGVVVVLSLLGYAISQLVGRHSRNGGSQDEFQDIAMLRQTVLTYTDCRKTVGLNPGDVLAKCQSSNTYILRDRTGGELFPKTAANTQQLSAKIADGNIRPTWEIRTQCDNDQLRVQRRQLGVPKSNLFSGWDDLWPPKQAPDLCRAYFSNENGCGGTYPVLAGTGPDEKELCCRMVENPGAAACQDEEYLIAGGAYCAETKDWKDVFAAATKVDRCYADAAAMMNNASNGSARGITMTFPSKPSFHTDPIIPAIMEARATYPKTKNFRKTQWPHGGFLLQSGYASLNGAAVVDTWVATCKMDDWEQGFATTARGYCCPKRKQK